MQAKVNRLSLRMVSGFEGMPFMHMKDNTSVDGIALHYASESLDIV